MARRNGLVFVIILVIFVFTLWVLLPIKGERLGRTGLRLGLDLVGGVHLVYQAQFSENATAADKSAAVGRALITIEKRIDTYGVIEPIIQKLGEDRILVQLPGYTDIDAAKKLVEQTGFLEFREVEKSPAGQLVYLSSYLESTNNDFINPKEAGNRVFVNTEPDEKGTSRPAVFLTKDESGLKYTDIEGNTVDNVTLQQYSRAPAWVVSRGDDGTPLTGDLLSDAQPGISDTLTGARPEVNIKWNARGTVLFDQIAARLYNPGGQAAAYSLDHVLGIFLDNALISDPQILAQKFQGTGVISGSFTTDSASELANLLKSGSLPVQLKKPPLYQEKVSATLGAEFVNNSWKAGLIGLALVMLFMIAYYRLPGLLASLALIFYGTLTLAICKLWPITLSLGGIGGVIISMGIAVDANVLIFERMKEEFRAGRTLGAAIEAGFHRAWTAIWDSNVTTFIACIILYWLGSSAMHNAAVTGFAVTLFIGAVVSMFTAVLVTRTLLRLFIGSSMSSNPWLFSVTGGKK
ncbi:MAG: protein-export membrane protein SecD [Chloroflexi bacterium RBG_16_56_11]|nr:MAG: protein-export membrane protein SecD [Chloroflexi bacterium RBG_16_56_11]